MAVSCLASHREIAGRRYKGNALPARGGPEGFSEAASKHPGSGRSWIPEGAGPVSTRERAVAGKTAHREPFAARNNLRNTRDFEA